MPDRYGEPRPGRDTPHDEPNEQQPHNPDPEPPPQPEIDYTATARRGIDRIRRQMGWK